MSRLIRIGGAFFGTAAFLLGGCGNDSSADQVATASIPDEPWTVPADLARVVAGDGHGWMIDQMDRLWRVDSDGEVTMAEVDLSPFRISFATFYTGNLVIGAERCDGGLEQGGCPGEIVIELVVVDQDGELTETFEVGRTIDEWRSSGGIRLLGILEQNDNLLMARTQGWVELSPNGDISESDIFAPPYGQALCMVNGAPAIIQDHTLNIMDGDPLTESRSSSDSISETHVRYNWTVEIWNGDIWEPSRDGNHSWQGEPVSPNCIDGNFVISTNGLDDHEAVVVWTPHDGWSEAADAYRHLDFDIRYSNDLYFTDLNTAYTLDRPPISRLDIASDDPFVPTGIGRASLEQGTHIEIDDSGTVLFACQQANGATRCSQSEQS